MKPVYRRLSVLLLVVTVVTAAAAGYSRYRENPAAAFVAGKIYTGDLTKTVTATGVVNAVVSVDVGSQVSGRIDALFADFNDAVRKGQTIAQLDRAAFMAELRAAEAALQVGVTAVKIAAAGVDRARSALATTEAKDKVLEAQFSRTLAAYEEAKRSLERKRSLKRKGALTEEILDRAKTAFDTTYADMLAAQAARSVHAHEINTASAELRQAEAALANAKAKVPQLEASLQLAQVNLARTSIRSPIDGVVIGREVDTGQTVTASLEAPKLFTIAQDLRQMEVHASVDEADIGRLQVGQTATFTVDAFPGRAFSGEVAQIRKSPERFNNIVSYTVVIATRNPELLLLPGMTAVVQITVYDKRGVVKLPNRALRFRPSVPATVRADGAPDTASTDDADGRPATVWVLDARGRPAPVPVRIGDSDAHGSELLSGGLSAGQEVLVGERVDDD